MADKWMTMHHPKLDNSNTEVTERAFENVFKAKGWKKGPKKVAKKKAVEETATDE